MSNRDKKSDNYEDILPSRKTRTQADVGEIFIDLDSVGKDLTFKKAIGTFLVYASMEDLIAGIQEVEAQIPTLPTPTYKIYSALLTQVGTSAPTATVLENTVGNIVWTRDSTGIYFGTLANAFTENKTWFSVIVNSNSTDANETLAIYWNNSSQIHVQTGIGTIGTDGRLYLNSIEIRVYN